MTLNARQRAFVEHYTAHHNAARAARDAGYSEHTARQQGHRLLTNGDIQLAITAREDDIANELGMTRQWLHEQYRTIVEGGLKAGDLTAARMALDSVAKIRGEFVDRAEVEHSGTVYTLDMGAALTDGDSTDDADDPS